MDEVEFAIFTQGQRVAEAAEVLRTQEVAMKNADRDDAISLADEAQTLAVRLEELSHKLLGLASRWH
jgi:hypothetical protein